MIPSVTSSSIAPKPAVATAPPTANKTTAPPAPDTQRGSVGETAAGNLKAETALAVDAPEQTAVAPRLRDQETAEQSDRQSPDNDAPTGPPPAFEESPLERQARVALDPPESLVEGLPVNVDDDASAPDTERRDAAAPDTKQETANPPPTPRERAEVSFAETRTISDQRNASYDVTR